jgi:hypothetical protein
MARSSRFLAALIDVFRPKAGSTAIAPDRPNPSRAADAGVIPASGSTVEVDPRSLGRVVLAWTPSADGVPDPGEIVWTWVPYEENDGRGKDRPILVVAAGDDGALLGIQLTSKDHDGDRDHVSIGTGAWDGQHRESWARLDRVFRVDVRSVRREASFLPERTYRVVAASLADRYGWSTV